MYVVGQETLRELTQRILHITQRPLVRYRARAYQPAIMFGSIGI